MRAQGLARFRIPPSLTRRWRARLRAQRRWWRERWQSGGERDVLFPAVGGGMVALETLAGGGAPGPRIAILHATAGSGHKRAAQALAASISALDPSATVQEVDALVYASRLYRTGYGQGYNVLAQRAPALWGVLYHSWELAPFKRGANTVRLMDRLNLRRLARVVERERPDAIVCTHFLPIEALSPPRGGPRLTVPLYCVITDFAAHPFWAFGHVDRYFVASEAVADELAGHGVPRARIEVTGIPIEPRFALTLGRDEARRRLGLPTDRPMVLVMGGGSGVGPLAELADRLAALDSRPLVWVVCGTHERARAEIEALPAAARGDVRALGFSNEVDVLLEACDVLVSKAGGLTCSEALVKQTPMVIYRPTPGQEVRNARFLEAAGAAVHADSLEDVAACVSRWLTDPAARERARSAARGLSHPTAAASIARRVLA
ncbi:MAG: glycosyltransferase, partial [Candidatus Eisenbacteria bacterium]|nr:glycosyltransferase [Candidatus Eisenbacteria bacterium]